MVRRCMEMNEVDHKEWEKDRRRCWNHEKAWHTFLVGIWTQPIRSPTSTLLAGAVIPPGLRNLYLIKHHQDGKYKRQREFSRQNSSQ